MRSIGFHAPHEYETELSEMKNKIGVYFRVTPFDHLCSDERSSRSGA